MRLHYLQHVPFEGPAHLAAWADHRGHTLRGTALQAGEPLPSHADYDWLIILGGPMNVDQHQQYPWLVDEKRFIGQSIAAGKHVLGVCLGGQLVARALGGTVAPNPEKEIGWFPVDSTPRARESLLSVLPSRFTPFHWHGDTFSLPPGAIPCAESEACAQQAFQWGDRVIGLQFHLEYHLESIETMITNCGAELQTGRPWIQSDPAQLVRPERVAEATGLLDRLLDRMAQAGK